MVLEFTLPYADSAFDSGYDVGDISVNFIHVLSVNEDRGIANTAENFLDTEGRPGLGYGQDV